MHASEIRDCIYKRLETDEEFRARVRNHIRERALTKNEFGFSHITEINRGGSDLDDYCWGHFRLQRKIVEVT